MAEAMISSRMFGNRSGVLDPSLHATRTLIRILQSVKQDAALDGA